MSKQTESFELVFTKTNAAVITERADRLGIVSDQDYLQTEVDKLVAKWKEEPCFL